MQVKVQRMVLINLAVMCRGMLALESQRFCTNHCLDLIHNTANKMPLG